jgi:hypothetical protein
LIVPNKVDSKFVVLIEKIPSGCHRIVELKNGGFAKGSFQRLKSQMDPIHALSTSLPEPRYFEYLITNISIIGDVGNLINFC